jgi:restriction system protein
MARRRKQSGAEDLMDMVAMLPWWAGVLLAIASYLLLHQLSVAPKPSALQPGQMGVFVQRTMLASLAFAGQFAVPPLCLVAAAVSFIRRRKREALIGNVTSSRSADALDAMSWREFELLVGEAFRLRGYKVEEQGGAQADGGVDLVLRKDGETFLVQCKQWKAFKVGVEIVRELFGVMAAKGATGGFVVTSGTFTAASEDFARGRNIMLVDGTQLFDMIRQAKHALAGSAAEVPPSTTKAAAMAAPQCPVCNAAMVRRTAQKGSKPGTQFWGCSKFPACRGTR